jgi:very-short-patch-repair endonuclease
LSFYKVVKQVVPAEFVIMAKPRILDVLYVPKRTKGKWAFENKIKSKHFDFVICDVQTMTPRLVIELDDKSHQRSDRQERDTFVDEATAAAGLPMMHVAVRASYVPNDLRTQILERLKSAEEPAAAKVDPNGPPICPKCGEAMVERVASRGANKGGKFWGCPNYPDCRGTAQ